MEPTDILHLYDLEMRIDPPAGLAEVNRRTGLTYLTAPGPSPFGGWVLYTYLEESEVDAAILAVIDYFKIRGDEFEWKVYDHDRPANLKDRLQARGFVPQEVEALLAYDLTIRPEQFAHHPAACIRRISNPVELPAVAQIQEEVWNEPFEDLVEMLSTEMEKTPDGISVFLAEVEGRPVSSAWIRYYPGRQFAELYGGSTIERYRGQGLYTALIAARVREARERGVRFLSVDTSPMSRPILEKLGFQFLTYSQPWIYSAPDA